MENIGIILVVGLVVGLQGYLSYKSGWFDRKQIELSGNWPALPFVWHGGIWGDVLFVAPAVAIIIKYSYQWQWKSVIAVTSFGLLASFVRHLQHIHEENKSCHNYGKKLTPAGWIHFCFMAAVFTLAVLFFIFSQVSVFDAQMVTVLFIGHFILAIIEPPLYLHQKISLRDWGLLVLFLTWLIAGYFYLV